VDKKLNASFRVLFFSLKLHIFTIIFQWQGKTASIAMDIAAEVVRRLYCFGVVSFATRAWDHILILVNYRLRLAAMGLACVVWFGLYG
jgi:hypothetical protein